MNRALRFLRSCDSHTSGKNFVLRLAAAVALSLAVSALPAQAQRRLHGQTSAQVQRAAIVQQRNQRAVAAREKTAAAREKAARALFDQAAEAHKLGNTEVALARYERLAQRYGPRDTTAVRVFVAWALLNKGGILSEQGKLADAIYTYDRVDRRFGEEREMAMREQVASALAAKTEALYKQGNVKKARATLDQLVRRYGDDGSSFIDQLITLTKWRTAEIHGKPQVDKPEPKAHR